MNSSMRRALAGVAAAGAVVALAGIGAGTATADTTTHAAVPAADPTPPDPGGLTGITSNALDIANGALGIANSAGGSGG